MATSSEDALSVAREAREIARQARDMVEILLLALAGVPTFAEDDVAEIADEVTDVLSASEGEELREKVDRRLAARSTLGDRS